MASILENREKKNREREERTKGLKDKREQLDKAKAANKYVPDIAKVEIAKGTSGNTDLPKEYSKTNKEGEKAVKQSKAVAQEQEMLDNVSNWSDDKLKSEAADINKDPSKTAPELVERVNQETTERAKRAEEPKPVAKDPQTEFNSAMENPEVKDNVQAVLSSVDTEDPVGKEEAVSETATKAGFTQDVDGRWKADLSKLDDRWSMWATIASCVLCAVTGGLCPPINFMSITGYDQRRDAALEQERMLNDEETKQAIYNKQKADAEAKGMDYKDYADERLLSAQQTAAGKAAQEGRNTEVEQIAKQGDVDIAYLIKKGEIDAEQAEKARQHEEKLYTLLNALDMGKMDRESMLRTKEFTDMQKALANNEAWALEAFSNFCDSQGGDKNEVLNDYKKYRKNLTDSELVLKWMNNMLPSSVGFKGMGVQRTNQGGVQ